MKMLIPNTIAINLAPTPGVDVVVYSPYEPLPQEHHDAQALVVWGGSHRFLSQLAQDLTQLEWIGALSAGIDNIEKAGFASGIVVTNASVLHLIPITKQSLYIKIDTKKRKKSRQKAVCVRSLG